MHQNVRMASYEQVVKKDAEGYEKLRPVQDKAFGSDFDKEVQLLRERKNRERDCYRFVGLICYAQ